MKLEERLKASDYLLLLLIALAFAGVSWIYQVNQLFSFDQTQMLLKGYYAAFTGHYLPYGNEASTMSNLPGLFSSWVIGFPMTIYMHPYAPAVFQTLLRIMGIMFFANAISLLFSRRIVLLGTFLFALSPWTLYQTMLYNPAYLTFCAPLALNCLIRLRNDRSDYRMRENGAGRFFASAILVIAIGIALQLHFSWPVLVAGAGILWLRRDIKVSYTGILAGAVVLGISLWPYVQEAMNNPNILNNPEAYAKERYFGYGLVNVYPVLKGILYWLRFASFSVTQKAIVPEIEDDYSLVVVILCWTWIIISQLIGAITVIIAAYSNMFVLSGVKAGVDADKARFIRGLTISYFLAVLIASAANTIVLNFWQIAVVLPFAMIPLLAWLSVRHNYIRSYFIAALVFFTFANAVGATRSDKFDYTSSFDKALYANCLYAFSKSQCEVLGPYLNDQQKAEVQAKYSYNQGIYDRVLRGLIPDRDGNLKPVKHYTTPLLGGESFNNASAVPVVTTAPVSPSPVADTASATTEATDAAVSATPSTEIVADAAAPAPAAAESAAAATESAAASAESAAAATAEPAASADAAASDKAVEPKAEDKGAATEAQQSKVENPLSASPELSEAYQQLAHSKLLEQAFPTLAAEIQNMASAKQGDGNVSGAGVMQSSANEVNAVASAAKPVADANNSADTTDASAKNESESTNQAQGADRKGASGSIVKANAPIIIDRAATKPASTGAIVDSGSGDSGELIIN